MTPFAAGEHLLGNLLHREIRIAVGPAAKGGAKNKQRALRSNFIVQLLELIVIQLRRGDVEEIPLRGTALLPVDGIAGRVGKALQLAERLGQHCGVVFLADDPIAPLVFLEQGWCNAVIAESAAALPVNGLGNAALIFAVDDFPQARNDVGVAVFSQLHHDPSAAHLVSYSSGCAGTSEGIEDEVARRRTNR